MRSLPPHSREVEMKAECTLRLIALCDIEGELALVSDAATGQHFIDRSYSVLRWSRRG